MSRAVSAACALDDGAALALLRRECCGAASGGGEWPLGAARALPAALARCRRRAVISALFTELSVRRDDAEAAV